MTLAHLLSACRPPRFSDLVQFVAEADAYLDFLTLVRRFLPDHERDILGCGGAGARLAAFAERFERRYFPLYPIFEDGMAEGYEDLTFRIPFIPLGISDDDYAGVVEGYSIGHRLLFALVGSPYSSDGDRVVLLEELAGHIPRALLERLPAEGYALETLHALLDGTPYEAAVKACDWLWSNTGIFFLDADDEYVSNVHEPWAFDVVVAASQDWRRARAFMNEVTRLTKQLDRNPETGFRKLLDFIAQQEVLTDGRNSNPAEHLVAVEAGAGG